MIFTSLGLILVALAFLIAGIAKSSVALLMVSLMLTLASGVVLVLVAGAARRLVEASASARGVALAAAPVAGSEAIMYVPVPAATGAVGAPGGNGGGAPPVIGYDDMTADQVVKLVRSGALAPEQLDAIRSYEEARQGRRTVLDAVARASR